MSGSANNTKVACELLIAQARLGGTGEGGKIKSPSWSAMEQRGLFPEGLTAKKAPQLWHQMRKTLPIDVTESEGFDATAKGKRSFANIRPVELELLKCIATDLNAGGLKTNWKACEQRKLLPPGMTATKASQVWFAAKHAIGIAAGPSGKKATTSPVKKAAAAPRKRKAKQVDSDDDNDDDDVQRADQSDSEDEPKKKRAPAKRQKKQAASPEPDSDDDDDLSPPPPAAKKAVAKAKPAKRKPKKQPAPPDVSNDSAQADEPPTPQRTPSKATQQKTSPVKFSSPTSSKSKIKSKAYVDSSDDDDAPANGAQDDSSPDGEPVANGKSASSTPAKTEQPITPTSVKLTAAQKKLIPSLPSESEASDIDFDSDDGGLDDAPKTNVKSESKPPAKKTVPLVVIDPKSPKRAAAAANGGKSKPKVAPAEDRAKSPATRARPARQAKTSAAAKVHSLYRNMAASEDIDDARADDDASGNDSDSAGALSESADELSNAPESEDADDAVGAGAVEDANADTSDAAEELSRLTGATKANGRKAKLLPAASLDGEAHDEAAERPAPGEKAPKPPTPTTSSGWSAVMQDVVEDAL